jgi:hypothetical protein
MSELQEYFPEGENFPVRFVISGEEISKGTSIPEAKPGQFVFFYITLAYSGVDQTNYSTDCCWRWDDGMERWVRFNDERYNRRT